MIDQEKRTQLLQEKYNQDSERYKEKQEEVSNNINIVFKVNLQMKPLNLS